MAAPTTATIKDRITCHVLDSTAGTPARGMRVKLELAGAASSHHHGAQTKMFESQTDDDGRIKLWLPYSSSNASGEVPVYTLDDVLGSVEKEGRGQGGSGPVESMWTLRFDVEGYFGKGKTFFPEAAVTFRVAAGEHYHVPLLLSPHCYTTYRGS